MKVLHLTMCLLLVSGSSLINAGGSSKRTYGVRHFLKEHPHLTVVCAGILGGAAKQGFERTRYSDSVSNHPMGTYAAGAVSFGNYVRHFSSMNWWQRFKKFNTATATTTAVLASEVGFNRVAGGSPSDNTLLCWAAGITAVTAGLGYFLPEKNPFPCFSSRTPRPDQDERD